MTELNYVSGVSGASGASGNVQPAASSAKSKGMQIVEKVLEVPIWLLTFALGGSPLYGAEVPADSRPTVGQLEQLYKFITDPTVKMFEGLTNKEKYQYKGMTNSRLANFGKGVNLNRFDVMVETNAGTIPAIISNMVLRIESQATGGAIGDFAKKFKDFQTAARNNGIYAMCYDCVDAKGKKAPKYDLIIPDGILGSQTVSAILFVYELGELAVEFGLVDSFEQYIQLFHKAKPGKDKLSAGTADPAFARIILLFKKFVKENEARILGEGVTLYQPDSSLIIGPKKGTAGVVGAADAIIAVYRLYRAGAIVKPTLDNIALTKDPNYTKLMIIKVIGKQDVVTYGAQKAVAEAKYILTYGGPFRDASGNMVTYTGDLDGGTWNEDFSRAMIAATGKDVIDADTAFKLLEIAEKRMLYVRDVINMKDNTNGKKLLEGVKGIGPKQFETWNKAYEAARRDNDTKSGQLKQIEETVVADYLAAMENDLQMIQFLLEDLHAAIDNLEIYLGNDSLVDVDEYQSVLDKLGPKGTRLIPRWDQIIPMLKLSKDGDINGVAILISQLMGKFQQSERNLEKSKTLKAGYAIKSEQFEQEVDRLRGALLKKIESLAVVKKAIVEEAVVIGLEDVFIEDDYKYRRIAIIREARKRLWLFDNKKVANVAFAEIPKKTHLSMFYAACEAVKKDELEARIKLKMLEYPAGSQELKDLEEKLKTINEKRNNMWRRAQELFAQKKAMLDGTVNRRKAGQAIQMPYSLEFDACLDDEILGRRPSYAGLALVQAYIEVFLGKTPADFNLQLEDGIITSIPKVVLCGFVNELIFDGDCK